MEAAGVTVVYRVIVAPQLIVVVVVVRTLVVRVLVGVGKVIVEVYLPENTVAGGSVDVLVWVTNSVSVLV